MSRGVFADSEDRQRYARVAPYMKIREIELR